MSFCAERSVAKNPFDDPMEREFLGMLRRCATQHDIIKEIEKDLKKLKSLENYAKEELKDKKDKKLEKTKQIQTINDLNVTQRVILSRYSKSYFRK